MVFPLRRLVSAWMAVWFALASVDPGWLHACPMHGRGTVEPTRAETNVADETRNVSRHASDHASHHASPDAADETPDNAPAEQPGHGSHQCVCLGDCNSATGGIALAVRVSLPDARVVAAPASAPTVLLSAVVRREALLLPFATAPPVRAL